MNRALMRKWLVRGIKISLGLSFFFLLIFTFMAQLGGNTPTLQKTVEEFISEVSGKHAVIGMFKGIQFFPIVSADFQNLSLYDPAIGQGDAAITVRAFQMASDFFDVAWRNGRFRVLNLQGLEAKKGAIFPAFLYITDTLVEERRTENEETNFVYVINGHLDVAEIKIEIPMQVYGSGKSREYRLLLEEGAVLTLGEKTYERQPLEKIWEILKEFKI